jgi:geranylgeranyl diphosphate synthase, type I
MSKSASPADRFSTFGAEYIPRIDEFLKDFFNGKMAGAELPEIREMYSFLAEYCSREGKRVRPLVMLISFFGYGGGRDSEDIIRIAAVLEMMHSFLLIQDDIIDRSELRRGNKALHVLCGERYGRDSHNPGIGGHLALILADVLFSGAIGIIARSGISPAAKDRFMKIFADTYEITSWGQILDILNSGSRKIASPGDTALRIATMKTAYYTVFYPMLMGHALAGRDSNVEQELIGEFSLPLGLAFQIRDDILGTFGNEETTGKPSDLDIAEGKITLLVDGAIERLDGREREKFIALFTRKNKEKKDIAKIRTIIDESGSLEAARRRHRELVDQSRKGLARLNIENDCRLLLDGLVGLIEKI